MKWLKKFSTHAEYEAYISGDNVAYPNVSVCNDEYEVHMTDIGEIVDPDSPVVDYSKKPFTIEIVSGSGAFSLTPVGDASDHLYYSMNGGEWVDVNSGSYIEVENGDKIQIKGTNQVSDGDSSFAGIIQEDTDTSDNLRYVFYGNIMSFVRTTGFENMTSFPREDMSFAQFFGSIYGAYCPGLVSAEHLVLPVTALTQHCYSTMFAGCSNLTTAPELPATTLTDGCYSYMFSGCRNLNYIKCLATDISAVGCTLSWVYLVASNGTFIKNASMSGWTTGEDGIPSNWTVEDAS